MEYLHGYTNTERNRLTAQAGILEDMIYEYLDLSAHQKMLEIGCGTGGQSKILLSTYSKLNLESFDISTEQIEQAKLNLETEPALNSRVNFTTADATKIPFEDNTFDAAFIVWVLEHSKAPIKIVEQAFNKLESGGKIYITEVFNHSFYLLPEAPATMEYWEHYNQAQIDLGGNPNAGIQLGSLLQEAGFSNIKTRNLNRHFDKRNMKDRNVMFDYFLSLLNSAKDSMIQSGRIQSALFEKVRKEFEMLKANPAAIFYYCPIQAEATKP